MRVAAGFRVGVADRMRQPAGPNRATAAVPPLAAAALAVGLGVLKRVVQAHHAAASDPVPALNGQARAALTRSTASANGRARPRGRAGPRAASRARVTPEHAAAAFAATLAEGRVPSLRQVKAELRVGTERARALRDHLAQLATSPPGGPVITRPCAPTLWASRPAQLAAGSSSPLPWSRSSRSSWPCCSRRAASPLAQTERIALEVVAELERRDRAWAGRSRRRCAAAGWRRAARSGLLRKLRAEVQACRSAVRLAELRKLRDFIDRLREEFHVPYPLADRRRYVGSGRKLMIDLQGRSELDPDFCLVAIVNGQEVLTAPGEEFFKRVEWSRDEPVAWRPAADELSPVRINPLKRFGRPAVQGVSTEGDRRRAAGGSIGRGGGRGFRPGRRRGAVGAEL